MTIEKAQQQIAELLQNCAELAGLLSDRIVGRFVDFEIEVNPKDIWVDFPNLKFSFKKLELTLSGTWDNEPKEKTQINVDNKLILSGKGKFECNGNEITKIYNLEIDESPDNNITPQKN
jgi:hypothetical protein